MLKYSGFTKSKIGHISAGGDDTVGVKGSGKNIGVWAVCTSTDNLAGSGVVGEQGGGYAAGYFKGKVDIQGLMMATNKAFKIDHPLDPANKYLYHTAIESPDMKNIYDGVITLDEQGEATVTLLDWFEALNSDYRYQLTALDTASPNLHISQRIKERKFKIAGSQPDQEVSWQVTGIRQDEWAKANRIPVEELKNESEKIEYQKY